MELVHQALEVPEVCTVRGPAIDGTLITTLRDHNLPLADEPPEDQLPNSTVSALIGSDNYWRVVTGRVERFNDNLCAVENLRLGRQRNIR